MFWRLSHVVAHCGRPPSFLLCCSSPEQSIHAPRSIEFDCIDFFPLGRFSNSCFLWRKKRSQSLDSFESLLTAHCLKWHCICPCLIAMEVFNGSWCPWHCADGRVWGSLTSSSSLVSTGGCLLRPECKTREQWRLCL